MCIPNAISISHPMLMRMSTIQRSSSSPVNPWLQQPVVHTCIHPSQVGHDTALRPQTVDPSGTTVMMPRPRPELTPDESRLGTSKAPDLSDRDTDPRPLAKESIKIQVQLHDDAETIKHIYLTGPQDGLWDLTDLKLGSPHRTEGKLNTGFTRKVIGDVSRIV